MIRGLEKKYLTKLLILTLSLSFLPNFVSGALAEQKEKIKLVTYNRSLLFNNLTDIPEHTETYALLASGKQYLVNSSENQKLEYDLSGLIDSEKWQDMYRDLIASRRTRFAYNVKNQQYQLGDWIELHKGDNKMAYIDLNKGQIHIRRMPDMRIQGMNFNLRDKGWNTYTYDTKTGTVKSYVSYSVEDELSNIFTELPEELKGATKAARIYHWDKKEGDFVWKETQVLEYMDEPIATIENYAPDLSGKTKIIHIVKYKSPLDKFLRRPAGRKTYEYSSRTKKIKNVNRKPWAESFLIAVDGLIDMDELKVNHPDLYNLINRAEVSFFRINDYKKDTVEYLFFDPVHAGKPIAQIKKNKFNVFHYRYSAIDGEHKQAGVDTYRYEPVYKDRKGRLKKGRIGRHYPDKGH